MKKYIFLIFFFIFGIFFISNIKNETRDIEKNIRNINTKIFTLNGELHEAGLDYDYLSSPTNLSILSICIFIYQFRFCGFIGCYYLQIFKRYCKSKNYKIELEKVQISNYSIVIFDDINSINFSSNKIFFLSSRGIISSLHPEYKRRTS